MSNAFAWTTPPIILPAEVGTAPFHDAMSTKGYCLVPINQHAIDNWKKDQTVDYVLADHLLSSLIEQKNTDQPFQEIFRADNATHDNTMKRIQHFFSITSKPTPPKAASEDAPPKKKTWIPKHIWPRMLHTSIHPQWSPHNPNMYEPLQEYLNKQLDDVHFFQHINNSGAAKADVTIKMCYHTLPMLSPSGVDLRPTTFQPLKPRHHMGKMGLMGATSLPFVCVEGSHTDEFRRKLGDALHQATGKPVQGSDTMVHMPLAIGNTFDPLKIFNKQVVFMVPPGYLLYYDKALVHVPIANMLRSMHMHHMWACSFACIARGTGPRDSLPARPPSPPAARRPSSSSALPDARDRSPTPPTPPTPRSHSPFRSPASSRRGSSASRIWEPPASRRSSASRTNSWNRSASRESARDGASSSQANSRRSSAVSDSSSGSSSHEAMADSSQDATGMRLAGRFSWSSSDLAKAGSAARRSSGSSSHEAMADSSQGPTGMPLQRRSSESRSHEAMADSAGGFTGMRLAGRSSGSSSNHSRAGSSQSATDIGLQRRSSGSGSHHAMEISAGDFTGSVEPSSSQALAEGPIESEHDDDRSHADSRIDDADDMRPATPPPVLNRNGKRYREAHKSPPPALHLRRSLRLSDNGKRNTGHAYIRNLQSNTDALAEDHASKPSHMSTIQWLKDLMNRS